MSFSSAIPCCSFHLSVRFPPHRYRRHLSPTSSPSSPRSLKWADPRLWSTPHGCNQTRRASSRHSAKRWTSLFTQKCSRKRPEDGVWAPWWYTTTHASTGFAPPALYPKPFPMEHYSLLEECQPFFSLLHSKALAPLTTTNATNDTTSNSSSSNTTTSTSPSPSLSTLPLPSPPLPVPANEKLLVWVGEEGLVPRRDAKIHVLDSAVQGGDAVWEGLRVYDGRVFKLQDHLDRLFDSAKAMAFANVPPREHVAHALVSTLAANGMRDNAHVRLTLTRGKKVTSGMSPHFNLYGCTLIVLAEWKPPVYDNARGIKLVTASTRRNSPQCVDSHIHHNNLINNILAKIEGNNAGADDAVMLDVHGYVSETNATNIFMVKRGLILTPHADSCLPGITRSTVIELAKQEGIPIQECNITTAQLHAADEIFTTGTMGELTPCVLLDNRPIGNNVNISDCEANSEGSAGPITQRLQEAYKKLTSMEGWPLPF
ncbi:hypothetical protein CLOM_g19140 [Closterium sp. NIES-68]|nr:hypothetical protein CLOM_g19140 [Closterium sp. NIES-68]